MKKLAYALLCLMTALCLAMPLAGAHAETSTDAIFEAVKQSIMERADEQLENIKFNQRVVSDSGVCYTVQNYVLDSAADARSLTARISLAVGQADATTGGICLCDYDFALLTRGSKDTGDGALIFHFPEHVYSVVGSSLQELMWPVILDAERDVELELVYTIPKDSVQLALIYSNMMGNNEDGVKACGVIYDYEFRRSLADFNLLNSTQRGVARVKAAPADEKAWSEELLDWNGISILEYNEWGTISLLGTAYEESRAEDWSLIITFDDGESCSFSGLDLINAAWVQLDMAEDGGFTVELTF